MDHYTPDEVEFRRPRVSVSVKVEDKESSATLGLEYEIKGKTKRFALYTLGG
jgi:hypothetical protein